jgi:hypothetical protein
VNECVTGEELITASTATAFLLAKNMTPQEIGEFCEFLGLVKHNLEIIKYRRFLNEKACAEKGK